MIDNMKKKKGTFLLEAVISLSLVGCFLVMIFYIQGSYYKIRKAEIFEETMNKKLELIFNEIEFNSRKIKGAADGENFYVDILGLDISEIEIDELLQKDKNDGYMMIEIDFRGEFLKVISGQIEVGGRWWFKKAYVTRE